MKLLLDTHVVLGLIDPRHRRSPDLFRWLSEHPSRNLSVSVVSLWEIAIKWRLGKLELPVAPPALPSLLAEFGLTTLPIAAIHVVAPLHIEPPTRDPFDRLLLAQCVAEDMRLLTVDRALIDHPHAAKWS